MLWAISRVAAPNFAAMREKGLQAHLDYLHSQKKILVVSGATLTDDGKNIVGSLLIINVNAARKPRPSRTRIRFRRPACSRM